jgi:glutaredoxin
MKVVAITKKQCPRCVQAKNLLEGDTRVTWLNHQTPIAQRIIADHYLEDKAAPIFIINDATVEQSMLRVKMMLDNSQ